MAHLNTVVQVTILSIQGSANQTQSLQDDSLICLCLTNGKGRSFCIKSQQNKCVVRTAEWLRCFSIIFLLEALYFTSNSGEEIGKEKGNMFHLRCFLFV